MEKLPFKETRNRAERPLQVINTDTMGPIKPTSYPGLKRLIVVFVDDYSRFAIEYSVKSKDEAGEVSKKYLISARDLLGKDEKICYIRFDEGTEFTGGGIYRKKISYLLCARVQLLWTCSYNVHEALCDPLSIFPRVYRRFLVDSDKNLVLQRCA